MGQQHRPCCLQKATRKDLGRGEMGRAWAVLSGAWWMLCVQGLYVSVTMDVCMHVWA